MITYKKTETAKQLKPNTLFETNTADIHFAIVYIAKILQILEQLLFNEHSKYLARSMVTQEIRKALRDLIQSCLKIIQS